MIERLLENWLDSATERSYQLPFCAMLINEGHEIVHSTRHTGLEEGKDVISVSPDGEIHAYQLKSTSNKRFSRNDWREAESQLLDLVMLKVNYPGLASARWHRSYLVVNADIEEEIQVSINNFNSGLRDKGFPERQVELISRGKLLAMTLALSRSLLPSELRDFRILGELYLEEGNNEPSPEKFERLLSYSMPFLNEREKSPSKASFFRAIASSALITAVASASYEEKNNHCAKIQVWVFFLAYISAVIEQHQLPQKYWTSTFRLVEQYVLESFENLIEEIGKRDHLLEGNALPDQPFYTLRVTFLVGVLSAFGIWNRSLEHCSEEIDGMIQRFLRSHLREMSLWGEGAVSSYVAAYWYLRTVDSTPAPEQIIMSVLDAVITSNKPGSKCPLASPYYSGESVVLSQLGLADGKISENFEGSAYTPEALLHLAVRMNWKRELKLQWPLYTYLMLHRVDPNESWQYLLWRTPTGYNSTIIPPYTMDWQELQEMAEECGGITVPAMLKKHPHWVPLFLVIYPHRFSSDIVRWFDSWLWQHVVRPDTLPIPPPSGTGA